MSTAAAIDPTLPATGLSQAERFVDTFVAPSKTFADIRRNASWWLPFLLLIVFSSISTFVVGRQVGFDRVYSNTLHSMPMIEDRINELPPEQKAQTLARGAVTTKYQTYGVPVLILGVLAIYSLILWASFNFGLGAQTTFPQVFAVSWYAALPYLITTLLAILVLYFGGNAEGYDPKNPVGTNLGYYMPDAAPWLKALLTQLDVVKIWSDILQVIGMSIIAKKTIAQSAMIVGIFWFLGVLLAVAAGAIFG